MSAFWLLISAAQAATLTVGPGGEFTVLQDAIDASAAGDQIEVAAGSYTGPFVIPHALLIAGSTDSETTLLGGATGPTVTSALDDALGVVTLQNLSIKCRSAGAVVHRGGTLSLVAVHLGGCGALRAGDATILSEYGRALTVNTLSIAGTTGDAPLINTGTDTAISGISIDGETWGAPSLIQAHNADLALSDLVVHNTTMSGGIVHGVNMGHVSVCHVEFACNSLGSSAMILGAATSQTSGLRLWKTSIPSAQPLVSFSGTTDISYSSIIGAGEDTLLELIGPEATLSGVALGFGGTALHIRNTMALTVNDSVLGTDVPMGGQGSTGDMGSNVVLAPPDLVLLFPGNSCDSDQIEPLFNGNLYETGPVDNGSASAIGATAGPCAWELGVSADADGDRSLVGDDCDDNDPLTYPGATEDLSDIDRDCDGHTDPVGPLKLRGCSTSSSSPGSLFSLAFLLMLMRQRQSTKPTILLDSRP